MTAAQAITAALLARERGHGGQHVELSMLDAVVSFLWADAAGNEVLMDSDGTRPSSFVATFRPFRLPRRVGHRHAHERRATSSASCAPSASRAADDPRVATIGERVKHRDLVSR